MIQIRPVKTSTSEVQRLIRDLDEYLMSLYPDESNHIDPTSIYEQQANKIFGLFEDHQLRAVGAVKVFSNYAEIKRMYVPSPHRGMGYGGLILSALERYIDRLGLQRVYLETGIHQPEAQALYHKMAYKKREPFGDYKADPLSVFFEKSLAVSMGDGKRDTESMVLFFSQLNPGEEEHYKVVHQEMKQLVSIQPGLLRILSGRSEMGQGFSTSFWESPESLKAWANHPDHLRAQMLGKTQFYSKYQTLHAEVQF